MPRNDELPRRDRELAPRTTSKLYGDLRAWERIKSKYVVDVETGCWIWLGAKNNNGYGVAGARSRTCLVHRIAYEIHRGRISPEMELDHLCRNRGCINPHHLEIVTHRENMRRGVFVNSIKTHCPSGHPYDEENTYRPPRGGRECRKCGNKRSLAYQARMKRVGV